MILADTSFRKGHQQGPSCDNLIRIHTNTLAKILTVLLCFEDSILQQMDMQVSLGRTVPT